MHCRAEAPILGLEQAGSEAAWWEEYSAQRCESRSSRCPEGFVDVSPYSSPRALSPIYHDDASVDSWTLSPSLSPALSPHGRDGREGAWQLDAGLIQVVEGNLVRLNMEQLIGHRRSGASDCPDLPHLTREEVMSLPCASAADVSCSICLEGFCAENPPRILPCQHAFHTDCAVLWLSKSTLCPNCRTPARCETEAEATREAPRSES